jgi:pyridoxine 5'-phosphate synthase PdxJ
LPEIEDLNIGHNIIARACLVGLDRAGVGHDELVEKAAVAQKVDGVADLERS